MDQIDPNALDLLTVTGASLAAGVITQAVKTLFTVTARHLRFVAVGSSVTLVTIAFLDQNPATVMGVVAAVLGGLTAGLATISAVDIAREGIDYRAARRP